MQIPLLKGIFTTVNSDYRVVYPRNMIPIPMDSGISNGYLRPSEGIVELSTDLPGICRGAINWNDTLYSVLGRKFCSVDEYGTATVIGDVGTDNKTVSMDYSFDRLAIASNEKLFLYDGSSLVEVTDPDLGVVLDVIWIDGYFMTTDGEYIVVTELVDPTAVDPFKYGSSEIDPDPVKAILRVLSEPCVVNRYTLEYFDNIGGDDFPFQRIDGAQVMKGSLSTHTCCVYLDGVAMLGSGRNEPPAIWLATSGSYVKLSTKDIDAVIRSYSESELEDVLLEVRSDLSHEFLYVHLPDRTLVYDNSASVIVEQPVWHVLTSSVVGYSQYRANHIIWCYDQWNIFDPVSDSMGLLDREVGTHWDIVNGWEFSTHIVYNKGAGAVFHELELVGITGNSEYGDDPTIFTSYSTDGVLFSQERPIKAGKLGERHKRLRWINAGPMEHWRLQKFRGTSDCRVSFSRLEITVEGLLY